MSTQATTKGASEAMGSEAMGVETLGRVGELLQTAAKSLDRADRDFRDGRGLDALANSGEAVRDVSLAVRLLAERVQAGEAMWASLSPHALYALRLRGETRGERERPTCDTCPHWREELGSDSTVGACMRRAPGPPVDGGCYYNAPMTGPGNSCGEHPDMPGWIAGKRASGAGEDRREAGDVPAGEHATQPNGPPSIASLFVVAREAIMHAHEERHFLRLDARDHSEAVAHALGMLYGSVLDAIDRNPAAPDLAADSPCDKCDSALHNNGQCRYASVPGLTGDTPADRLAAAAEAVIDEVRETTSVTCDDRQYHNLMRALDAYNAASTVVAPPVIAPESRTPAGDRLARAARDAVAEVRRSGSLMEDDGQFPPLTAALDAYDALPIAPAPDPSRVSVNRAALAELKSAARAANHILRLASMGSHEQGRVMRALDALSAPESPSSPPQEPSRVSVNRAALAELRAAAWAAVHMVAAAHDEGKPIRLRLAQALDAVAPETTPI